MKFSAHQIADYFIVAALQNEDGELMTNLKLQKLLYFAEGCAHRELGSSLFPERLEAWELGPVVPEIYRAFKPCGRNPIEEPIAAAPEFPSEVEIYLGRIIAHFGRYSAQHLVRMSHADRPWIEAYRAGRNAEMKRPRIVEHFATHHAIEVAGHPRDLVEILDGAVDETRGKAAQTADELLRDLSLH